MYYLNPCWVHVLDLICCQNISPPGILHVRNKRLLSSGKYRVTGNAQILEKALFPKLKLTKDLN